MTENITPSPVDPTTQEDRKRKRKALLAGGLVLGLGAAVTLAAWSDDVFATGLFDTGTFELQGNTVADSVGHTGWADYDGPGPEEGAAQLSFDLVATNMSPSQTVYAPLSIGTSQDTTLTGSFQLDGVTYSGPLADVLTYQIFDVDGHGTGCTPPTGPGGGAWASGEGDLDRATGTPLGTPLAVGAEQTDAQNLCIAVTMADQSQVEAAIDDAAGADLATTITWVFTGTSDEDAGTTAP